MSIPKSLLREFSSPPTRRAHRRWAGAAAVWFAGFSLSACGSPPSDEVDSVHDERLTPGLIGQRILYCDDGSKVDVDFIADGLEMAATWLPKGQTELLRAQQTGGAFQGRTLRAVVTDGSIAFFHAGQVQVCSRTPEAQ